MLAQTRFHRERRGALGTAFNGGNGTQFEVVPEEHVRASGPERSVGLPSSALQLQIELDLTSLGSAEWLREKCGCGGERTGIGKDGPDDEVEPRGRERERGKVG